MIFMGADNVPGDASLKKEAEDTIRMLNEDIQPSDSINIFVQLHADGRIERQHVWRGKRTAVNLALEDSTNGKALTRFLDWAMETSEHRPGDYSMLVMWGHTFEFGVGPQVLRNGIDALDFAELSDVMGRFQQEHARKYPNVYGPDEVPKLNIIGFDACDVATVEMACQLEPFADYLLASQIGVPLPGWPYGEVLGRLRDPKGDVMGPAELGSYIARRYCAHYAAQDRRVTLSMLDLKRAPTLFDLAERLARRLALVLDDGDEFDVVYDLFFHSRTPDDRPFIDVADFCLNLMRDSGYQSVRQAAEALGDFLITPNPGDFESEAIRPSAVGVGRPFIVENSRNSADTAGLNGVSLYAPHVADHDFEKASYFYDKFAFAQKTLWGQLVQGLAMSQ